MSTFDVKRLNVMERLFATQRHSIANITSLKCAASHMAATRV